MGKSKFVGYKPVLRSRWKDSMAASASAIGRQCPSCGRKSAIQTMYDLEWGYVIKTCRWCDYRQERKITRSTD